MKKKKLIKPKNIDAIIGCGIVYHRREDYMKDCWRIAPLYFTCAVRCKFIKDPQILCEDMESCKQCFLNAKNYLNVLKYKKHHNL